MPPQTLRGYQTDALRKIAEAYRDGARRVLLVVPTGGGKTSIFSEFARRLSSPGLVLVHRRELAAQAADRLKEFGVDVGMVIAGERETPGARVQIATLPSLRSRGLRPPARFVIPDEAHLSTADTWAQTLADYPEALILGCTATPWRLSGKPLSGSYDRVIVGATPSELRELGYLCPFNGFSYKTPDLSKLRKTAGDYNEHDADEAMRQPAIVTNIVEKWQAHASQLSTIVFCVTIEHSKQLAAEFKAAGVAAEHVDGSTPRLMRKAIFARVARGETQVLCNVGIAIEGIDIPRLKCCVLARPTMSLTLYLQMVGRVMRPWEGVTARIHDHAFVIRQHGLPDQERDYSLHAKPEKPPPLTRCKKVRRDLPGRHLHRLRL
jgi:superfamily II DNA or RNA helicase